MGRVLDVDEIVRVARESCRRREWQLSWCESKAIGTNSAQIWLQNSQAKYASAIRFRNAYRDCEKLVLRKYTELETPSHLQTPWLEVVYGPDGPARGDIRDIKKGPPSMLAFMAVVTVPSAHSAPSAHVGLLQYWTKIFIDLKEAWEIEPPRITDQTKAVQVTTLFPTVSRSEVIHSTVNEPNLDSASRVNIGESRKCQAVLQSSAEEAKKHTKRVRHSSTLREKEQTCIQNSLNKVDEEIKERKMHMEALDWKSSVATSSSMADSMPKTNPSSKSKSPIQEGPASDACPASPAMLTRYALMTGRRPLVDSADAPPRTQRKMENASIHQRNLQRVGKFVNPAAASSFLRSKETRSIDLRRLKEETAYITALRNRGNLTMEATLAPSLSFSPVPEPPLLKKTTITLKEKSTQEPSSPTAQPAPQLSAAFVCSEEELEDMDDDYDTDWSIVTGVDAMIEERDRRRANEAKNASRSRVWGWLSCGLTL
jgi:hypothetical protein